MNAVIAQRKDNDKVTKSTALSLSKSQSQGNQEVGATTGTPLFLKRQTHPVLQAPHMCKGCEEELEEQEEEQPQAAVQIKLIIGAADDPLEKEADEAADQVVRLPESSPRGAAFAVSEEGELLNRNALQHNSAASERLEGGTAPSGIRRPTSGSPIARPLRDRIESVLDTDLGGVQVHDDAASRAAAHSLGAKAFTHGSHIWLGPGESSADEKLLAHEAAHVVQQHDGGAPAVQRKPSNHTHAEDKSGPRRRMRAEITEELGDEEPPEGSQARPPAVSEVQTPTAPPSLPPPPAMAQPPEAGEHPPSAREATEHTEGAEAAGHAEEAPAEPEIGEASPEGSEDSETAPGEATAGTGGGGGRWEEQEEGADAGTLQEARMPVELEAVDALPVAPPPLEWKPLKGEWPLPGEPGAEALPQPESDKSAKQEAQKGEVAKPAQGSEDKGATQSTAPDPEEGRRKTRAAAEAARHAWQELSATARREQEGFVKRANRTVDSMARTQFRVGEDIEHALETDLASVDAAAAQAAEQMGQAADFTLAQLEGASRDAHLAIIRAGRRAYGLISAGEARAAGEIALVVADLVSGHTAAYNEAISRAREAADAALLAINDWRDQRETNFPIAGDSAMAGAKNESLQARIPRWTDPEAIRIGERVDAKVEAWTNSRNSTRCSMECGYRSSLEADNCNAAQQARGAVRNALRDARSNLRRQDREGHRTLADLRHSYLQQIATQQRATKSRLSSQARGTLGAMHGEVRGAIKGVQSAAGAAIPGYWRGVDGFRKSLRGVASKGSEAVQQTIKKVPGRVLGSLERSSTTLDDRLTGNRERLKQSLTKRARGHRDASKEQKNAFLRSLQEQGSNSTQQLDEASAGFVDAFAGLADTVLNAAESWAQPATVRMAASIQAKQGEAQRALEGLLTGQQQEAGAGGGGGSGANTEGRSDEGGQCAAATCGSCDSASGGKGGTSGGKSTAPQGLITQVDEEVAFYDERLIPEHFFDSQISASESQVEERLNRRAVNVAQKFEGGFAGTVDETGVIAQLRGLTSAKGRALDLDAYPTATSSGTLESELAHFLGADSDDYAAAHAYLSGNAVEGARLELADSTGFFNDDEARIEAVMRALSPDQLRALGEAHQDVMNDVRDALGGTDLEVFDALAAGNHARADAYRLRDAVDKARRDGNADSVHSAIEQYTGAPQEGDWRAAEEVDSKENRAAVVRELGGIVGEVAGATTTDENGEPLSADQLAVERAVAYVSRDIEVYVGGGPEGQPQTITMRLEGANRDLAGALLRHGPDSIQARVARLGVEMQRRGDPPNPLNIDRAMFDQRFTPDSPNASPEELQANERARAAARADRERVLLLAAQNYAGDSEQLDTSHDPSAVMDVGYRADTGQVSNARQALIDRMGARFGSDTLGAQLAAGLLTDERPSARTTSLAMQHAQAGAGTNEELLFRFTERMTPDEMAAMRVQYREDTGRSLDADLGTYGEGGTFTELSGDDRLRMERALRGVARTDQERLENAAFAIAQQRRETGAFGTWLAEGSLADQVMNNTERQLQTLVGGPIRFNQRGELTSTLANFSRTGEYTGADHDHFRATTAVAQTVAENYSKRIDAYADIATTGIAVLGAIAAAVITVVTGGAAAPLIAAALIAGLASMGANYAIKGGRYGWEQAAIDLGMTAVQAVTAGVGAQLGAAAQIASKGAAAASMASRSLVTLSRLFTGNPVIDQIIVGAITGSIGGLGNAAFDEHTWEHGSGDAVSSLFAGLLKGSLSGAATAALTNSIEALGRNGQVISERARALAAQGGLGRRTLGLAGRGFGRAASGLDEALNASTGGGITRSASAMLRRGLARGTISGLGGMAGRGSDILVDAARGRFKGDAGDALLQMGEAGLHSFVQGIGEGAGEARGQAMRARRLEAASEAITRERVERGLEPLDQQALRAAADDLLFLNQHGRNGGDGLGRALNLNHIATHGGLAATVATRHPEPFVEDGMRAALLRHVPPELHADFADVQIRIMADTEYRALTRSESGPVVTLVENGQPVVVIREGTPIARLADEGPHLQQTRDRHTRERVSRLDEATLARWDSLDLDTQLSLYQNKLELEIDAHQRIADSLVAELARGTGDAAHLTVEIERNANTLRNLRERYTEVEALGPAQRSAIAEGDQPRPQYLEQPARLFSKETRPPPEAEPTARRAAGEEEEGGPRLQGESGHPTAVRAPAEEAPRTVFEPFAGPSLRSAQELQERYPGAEVITSEALYPPVAGEIAEFQQRGGRFLEERFGQSLPDNSVDRMHVRFSLPHKKGSEAHLPTLMERYPGKSPLEAVEAYQADIESIQNLGPHALRTLTPDGTMEVVYHEKQIGDELDHLQKHVWTDSATGERYRLQAVAPTEMRPLAEVAPHSGFGISAESPSVSVMTLRKVRVEEPATADAREHLMRHIPPKQRAQFADTPIRILPEAEYHALTRSDAGPVMTQIIDGRPVVVVREGTPPARLADEGPHLMQAHEHGERVARLDEAQLARWDSLDLDTQLELYQNKIGLEIEAHQQIQASLEAEQALGVRPAEVAAEIESNAATLRNLHERQAEVATLGPAERAAIATGQETRPQYLEQPPRLFSKDAPLAQRFAAELAGVPALQLELMAISRIPDARGQSRARAELHVRLVSLRYLSNLAEGGGLLGQGSDFSLLRLQGVARLHRRDAAAVARDVQEILHSGRHPEGVAADSPYGRALLGLAESLAGPRSTLRPRVEIQEGDAAAPRPREPQIEPEPPRAMTEEEIRHAERVRKVSDTLPKTLAEWDLDKLPGFARLFDADQELVMLKVNRALTGDSIEKAGEATKRAALAWALRLSDGDPSEFANYYEYARALFDSAKRQAQRDLIGQSNKKKRAMARAATVISEEHLDATLAADFARVRLLREEGSSALDALPADPAEIGRAVQQLAELRFATDAAEVYHARKHGTERELPPEFVTGDPVRDFNAALRDTVRTGAVEVVRPTHTESIQVVIRKTYGANPGVVMEAIIYVRPNGNVIIATYGKAKMRD